ncbi:MAG: hypothetical protein ACRC41_04285 [Sarcina sp.]
MKNLVVRGLKNNSIYTFMGTMGFCWSACEVASLLGYEDSFMTVKTIMLKEGFKLGVEFEVLKGRELEEFLLLHEDKVAEYKGQPELIMFYEEGLYGFILATWNTLGLEHKKWIRREVMPKASRTGLYIKDEFIQQDRNITLFDLINVDVNLFSDKIFDNYFIAYDTNKEFLPILDQTIEILVSRELFMTKALGKARICL